MPIHLSNQNQQWVPIWAGLVIDQKAQHYQRLKNAIWLFLYLVLNASKTGFLTTKIKTICSETGIKRNNIIRWLNILRNEGYIATQNTGRGLFIQVRRWQNLTSDVTNRVLQKHQRPDFCGEKNPITEVAFNRQNELNCLKNPQFCPNPIDSINKYILKNDIDSNKSLDLPLKASNQSKSMELAMDIAQSLEDQENLALYISYCRKYPLSLVRSVLDKVRQIPSEKVKKSRGALFNYLVQKYAKEIYQNLSH